MFILFPCSVEECIVEWFNGYLYVSVIQLIFVLFSGSVGICFV
jgi:hypothetical protein